MNDKLKNIKLTNPMKKCIQKLAIYSENNEWTTQKQLKVNHSTLTALYSHGLITCKNSDEWQLTKLGYEYLDKISKNKLNKLNKFNKLNNIKQFKLFK